MSALSSNYLNTMLKEITVKIGSGATPRGGKESYKQAGISLIRSLNVYDFKFEYDNLAFIDDEQASDLSNVEVQRNDLLLNITGASVARCCMVPAKVLPARVNQHVSIIRIDPIKAAPNYVLYTLNSYRYKQKLLSIAQGGATREALTKEKIESFEIILPFLSVQHKVASILSAYDDLIENNNRRIKILEEMAHDIYREWFVNFRFPGHEKVKMVMSELGMIPEGWKNPLPNHVDFKEGPGLRRWQYREEGVPFLNIRTLVDNDIDLAKVQYIDEDEVKQKYEHFLLAPYDHVVSSSGTLGRIVTIREDHLPLMLNTSIIRMRAKSKNVQKWQLKHFLMSDYFQNQILSKASGVAQVNYGPSHLNEMWIIAPMEHIGSRYENLIEPWENEIQTLVQKNNNLRKTRNLLLPKLISGEIDVEGLDIKTEVIK